MIRVEDLALIEEIKQLKARYFRFCDTRDLEGYAALFTEDAKIDVRGAVSAGSDQPRAQAISDFDNDRVIIGGAAFVAFVSRITLPGTVSAHHGHMPEIEILSPTTACGIWAMEDHIWFPPQAPYRSMHGYGHYHETYEKQHDCWLIASMTLTRLKVELT